VGINLTTWNEQPLAHCEGQIVSTFRELKSAYEKLRREILDTVTRIFALETALEGAPVDFQYPKGVLTLDKLQTRPALIDAALSDVTDDKVDRLRSEFDGPARLGNFQPLMSRARDLLDEPRGALAQLLGYVISVENAIAEYRKKLVENAEAHKTHRGLEALARARGGAAPAALTLRDLEDAGALLKARNLVIARIQENTVTGERVLGGTCVSFDRWCAIVMALDAGRDPALEPQEADALVQVGLVQRTYRLGIKS
jgi:hypothetical protein